MSLSWTAAAAWLLHCAVGGGLLLLLTCLLIRRTRQPARRQRLGELGLAAALLLALLSLRPPWLVVSSPFAAPATPPRADRAAADADEEEPLLAWVAPLDEAAAAPAPAADPPLPPPNGAEGPALPWWQPLRVALPWLVIAHLVGAAFLLGRWLLGHLALARLLRGAGTAPAEVAAFFEAMTPGPRRPRLLVARRPRVPLSCGLLRPTVVLPAALCERPDLQKLRWVFAHELTHLERRDAWSAALFALGQAVYFFLPWFGWLRRQVRLCQEYVADAAAAGARAGAVEYAEFLLSLTRSPAVPAAATGVSGDGSDLYRRVSMLLKEPLRVEKRCPRRWSLAAAGGLFALAFLVGGLGVRADAAPQVVIILPGQADAGKPEEAKKTRVLVVPAPGQHRPQAGTLFLFKGASPLPAGTKKPVLLPGAPGQPRVVIQEVDRDGNKFFKVIVEKKSSDMFFYNLDVDLVGLRKMLERLEQQGGADVEELRNEIRKALAHLPDRLGRRHLQQPEAFTLLKRKMGEKPEKELDAALDALRKALDRLKARPDLEEARQQLKKAIEQVERRRLSDPGFFAPSKALLLRQQGSGKAQAAPLRQSADGWELELKIPAHAAIPLPPGKPIDPELLKRVRDLLRQQKYAEGEALLKKALEGAQPRVLEFNVHGLAARPWLVALQFSGTARLGLTVEKPAAALADQLDLPRDKGLLVTKVRPDSPAARGGIQVNDVLLKVSGLAVPNDPAEFARALDRMKAGTPLSAVVLRKGKEVGGIKLPEPTAEWRDKVGPGLRVPQQGEVMTTLLRSGDRFTTRYQEGSLVITLTGTAAGGKAKLGEVHIQDARQTAKYDSVERVPAQYRDKVNHLLEISGRGELRMQGNRP